MRRFIKQPTAEVQEAIACMIDAADAHVAGDHVLAAKLFSKSNCPSTWAWLNDAWIVPRRNVVILKPNKDSSLVPKAKRDPDRNIRAATKKAVLKRDGYRCRYCGLPVVSAEIRKIANRLYPLNVPWNSNKPEHQHAAFQATWLQYDHVEPHSHGGRSSPDNLVVCCALCNFGKDGFTLWQLDLEDPRRHPPVRSDFDGLERLRMRAPSHKPQSRAHSKLEDTVEPPAPATSTQKAVGAGSECYFFPGAWISEGYVYTPPINGKGRWFRIGQSISAKEVDLNGDRGCIVSCPSDMIVRRGIAADLYRLI